MKKSTQQNINDQGRKLAVPPRPVSHGAEQAVVSCGEHSEGPAHTPEEESTSPNDDELARSLQAARALPDKFSRSKMLPFAEILLDLRRKCHGYRFLQDWLKEKHGIRRSVASVHKFVKRAEKAQRRRQQAERRKGSTELTQLKTNASSPSFSPGKESPHLEKGGVEEFREAIRAAKERSSVADKPDAERQFKFDGTKPLISKQQPKPNRENA